MTPDGNARELAELLAGLPPEPREADLLPAIQQRVRAGAGPLVVVDDDPTGVQTVSDTTVLLDWTAADVHERLAAPEPLFFLLTNSRSLPEAEAVQVNQAIGQQVAAARPGAPPPVASRSDSTLRGHYPAEVLALAAGLGQAFDGHLLVPAFIEGGRYTIADTHWVAVPEATADRVVPASATPFARDPVFGYGSAHLPTWVADKSRGRWRAEEVQTLPLAVVRAGPAAVRDRLAAVQGGVPVVVNAAGYGDLAAFVLGLLQAEAAGQRFLYRTGASFVRLRAGLVPRPLLTGAQVLATGQPADAATTGLVVVGSHVPATTQQLTHLLGSGLPVAPVEVDVRAVLAGRWAPADAAARLDDALASGRLPVLFTSRDLVTGPGDEHLAIGRRVTEALLATLAHLTVRPRFVIAKGGITSHEVARCALGARRATVLGQLLPGVPVWRLEAGPDLRFPGLPYVVFPGNVGGPDGLLAAVQALTGNHPSPPGGTLI